LSPIEVHEKENISIVSSQFPKSKEGYTYSDSEDEETESLLAMSSKRKQPLKRSRVAASSLQEKNGHLLRKKT